MISSQSLAQRNRIIEEHRAVVLAMRGIEKEIETLLKTNDPRWKELELERNKLYVQIEPLIEQYWDWVPAIHLSRCPICARDLECLFDPVDLNGFWWMDRTQRERPQPKACEHFCLLSGALDPNGLALEPTLFECRPGPRRPFVVPRILQLPEMTAVVSELKMVCGYTAFPIAYFSLKPLKGRSLTQSWARKEYHFVLENGQRGWDIVEDTFDFELAPWISSGKLKWFKHANEQ